MACKLLGILFGHQYSFQNRPHENHIFFTEEMFRILTLSPDDPQFKYLSNHNIVMSGFFQRSQLYVKYRDQLIQIISNSDDSYVNDRDEIIKFKDFLDFDNLYPISHQLSNSDIVISLRLGDFIQWDKPTTEIPHPIVYLKILNRIAPKNQRIFIVCDKLRFPWEQIYLQYFQKYNPILIQGDVKHDFNFLKRAKILIHSPSTFCYLASFFAEDQKRYLVRVKMHVTQDLDKIDPQDTLIDTRSLTREELFNL